MVGQFKKATFSHTRENSKMFNITSKYFSFLNNKPRVSWVAHKIRDFLTCYSSSYYNSMVEWSNANDSIIKQGENDCALKVKVKKLNALKWIAILNIQGLNWVAKNKNYVAIRDHDPLNLNTDIFINILGWTTFFCYDFSRAIMLSWK